MTYAELIAFINLWIYTNHNNEITAATLNPVLQAIADRSQDVTGNLEDLATTNNTNLVAAINEVLSLVGPSGVRLYSGMPNPNITPPSSFNYADFYMQVDLLNQPVLLYQYNGFNWVTYYQFYVGGHLSEAALEASVERPILDNFGYVKDAGGAILEVGYYTGDEWVFTPFGGGGSSVIPYADLRLEAKGFGNTNPANINVLEIGDVVRGWKSQYVWWGAAVYTGGDPTDRANYSPLEESDITP